MKLLQIFVEPLWNSTTHENWNDHHSDTKSIVRSGVGTHGVPIIALTRPEFTMLPDNRREARLQTK